MRHWIPKGASTALVGIVVMLLAVAIVAGLFTLELPEGNREVALVILGTVIGWAGAVVNYHYGSSEGSKRKTDMLLPHDQKEFGLGKRGEGE